MPFKSSPPVPLWIDIGIFQLLCENEWYLIFRKLMLSMCDVYVLIVVGVLCLVLVARCQIFEILKRFSLLIIQYIIIWGKCTDMVTPINSSLHFRCFECWTCVFILYGCWCGFCCYCVFVLRCKCKCMNEKKKNGGLRGSLFRCSIS